ncbi:uncharacterized protein [Physcomitrium patens]|uniref:Uncharacterized protein n=1 Tax=Physcomitrium patens TaxID=3218 RepID=A0A2K1K232_PHYPA|nr:uncharacterized protein LOC112287158 [Physcomitrium patens]PNR47838.1 hypothetical protein PHYPA_012311 [Physcomitrium patens]|eukprot:XP_024385691.1 uncharacterized protein LOC112287158 [Physcomitrella patens]
MQSNVVNDEAPRRDYRTRCVSIGLAVEYFDAGWPLARHGQNIIWPNGLQGKDELQESCDAEGAKSNKLGYCRDGFQEDRIKPKVTEGAEERSFDALAQQVDELIERQPQFAFLKPCRQLEKHYAFQRSVGNSNFHHGGNKITATETQYRNEERELMHEVCDFSSLSHKPQDIHLKPGSKTSTITQRSREELEDAQTEHCRVRDSDARSGNTIRELLSTASGANDVERGLRETTSEHRVSDRKHHNLAVSIPFKWEEKPEKPRSIAAAAERALARKLTNDGIKLNLSPQDKLQTSSSQRTRDRAGREPTKEQHHELEQESAPRRSTSERFLHGAGHVRRNSGESRIWRISSTRCSIHEKEAHIDLDAPAAAKCEMKMSDSPLYTPNRQHNASPPAVAVPFKWEDAPGKAKVDRAARNQTEILQLPPRLVVPIQRSSGSSFSHELRVSVVSHPLAGLFPCMSAASSPARPQYHDHTWIHHYRATKNLLQKNSQPHHGYGGHQDLLSSKSGDRSMNRRKLNKSFSQPLTSTDSSPKSKPHKVFSSELNASHSWMQQSGNNNQTASDPTSILQSSCQSSSSRTYLSCEFDAFTPRTADSKASSSASYESLGEDFTLEQDHESVANPSYINKPRSFDSNNLPGYSEIQTVRDFSRSTTTIFERKRTHPSKSEGIKGLLKLCKSHSNCLGKSKSSRRRLGPLYSPEVWAPTLATYFQRLDVTEPAISSGLLDKGGAPTSSGHLNSNGDPVLLHSSRSEAHDTSVETSPERPTRLPYKMPSVAEQELAARNPRTLAEKMETIIHGERQRISQTLMNRVSPVRFDNHWISPRHQEDFRPSPAYAAALEMLSPARNLVSKRHKASNKLPSSSWTGPKTQRRVQFIISICKTLKRVLFRQQTRRSVIGTTMTYHEDNAPTTFKFSKPN